MVCARVQGTHRCLLCSFNHRGMSSGGLLIKVAFKHIPDRKILCCNKNPARAAVLQKQGISPIGWTGTKTVVSLSRNTIARLVSMLLCLEFRRVWNQGKGIHKYERYHSFVINPYWGLYLHQMFCPVSLSTCSEPARSSWFRVGSSEAPLESIEKEERKSSASPCRVGSGADGVPSDVKSNQFL